jgi:Zn ribbon nucleic-acid-binding protein
MGSASTKIECPKCGYEHAVYTLWTRIRDENITCVRCGYCQDFERDFDASDESGKPVWNVTETGGTGCCILKEKGQIGFAVSPIENVLMDEVKEALDEYEVCRYTFWKDEQWYIKDLLKNTEHPFVESDLLECN